MITAGLSGVLAAMIPGCDTRSPLGRVGANQAAVCVDVLECCLSLLLAGGLGADVNAPSQRQPCGPPATFLISAAGSPS